MSRKHKEEKLEADLPDSKNEAELKVKTVLGQLVGAGEILGFIHAKQYSQLDTEGMDFQLALKGGLFLPVQVKIRNEGTPCKKVAREHLERHPLVECILFVNIKKRNHLWTLEKRIRRFIRKASCETAENYCRKGEIIKNDIVKK